MGRQSDRWIVETVKCIKRDFDQSENSMTDPKVSVLWAKKNRVELRKKLKKTISRWKIGFFYGLKAVDRILRVRHNIQDAGTYIVNFPAEGHAGNVYEVKVDKLSRFVITFYHRSGCQIIIFSPFIFHYFFVSAYLSSGLRFSFIDYRFLSVKPVRAR